MWDLVRRYILYMSEPCILCQPQTPRDSTEVLGFMGQLIITHVLFMTVSLLIGPYRTWRSVFGPLFFFCMRKIEVSSSWAVIGRTTGNSKILYGALNSINTMTAV